jgi:serine/threonine-protein kinase
MNEREPSPPSAAALSHSQVNVLAETAPGVPDPTEGLAQAEPSQVELERAPLPFQNWDRYKITACLGFGGMGSVYRAQDPRLKRTVAIKFLRAGQLDSLNPRQRRLFEREARAQARIDHPNICKIYEVGEVEGQPYIAMQLVSGSTFAGMHHAMSLDQKIQVVKTIAEALHCAHRQGIVHRDMKPTNIMIERRTDGTYWPYLMDFGIAREMSGTAQSTASGIQGTPAFMSPEQARGDAQQVDQRSDVYGLGATLYFLLSGRAPFVGPSSDVLLAVLTDDPPRLRALNPTIPRALETIVQTCLDKVPRRRYHSAQALAEDLGRYLDGSRILARPPGLLHRAGRFALRHKLLASSAATALIASLVLIAVGLRIRWQAAEQARLSQRLGQEIAKMEWLLRSGRQLPLHALDREKVIVRRRMAELQSELNSYGPLSRGLAHYALGWGHMALHEYPEALIQLELAIKLGTTGPEVDYALGLVLGKHYERAMHEARLAGGGDWAKARFKELEPRYLAPAIALLVHCRTLKLDAPQYLEGLIAYYQHDYEGALRQAQAALREAPWLYEAPKLAGDVHLERALIARDAGRAAEADSEFRSAVQSYQTAASMGQSDAEVYEGLAEAWLRQIETSVMRGRPAETAYTAAVAASDKLMAVEPQSIAGPLKKAFAAMLTMGIIGSGLSSADRIKQCLAAADAVLRREPGNAYAREAAANCHANAAEQARTRGEDPEPHWEQALLVFEDALRGAPRFLWGLNDIANIYVARGGYRALHGSPTARKDLEKALRYYEAATQLDEKYSIGWQNSLGCLDELALLAETQKDRGQLIQLTETAFQNCTAINASYPPCYSNYMIFYARLAKLSLAGGEDPQPYLRPAQAKLASLRALGGSYLDVEQHAALLYLVAATQQVRRREDPTTALAQTHSALDRCLALAAEDAMCRTLEAQADWVAADWLALQGQPFLPVLHAALAKAIRATRSPEQYPDAWLVLAQTRLRLARAVVAKPPERQLHINEGLAAASRIFAMNPRHALGRATRDELQHLLTEEPSTGGR